MRKPIIGLFSQRLSAVRESNLSAVNIDVKARLNTQKYSGQLVKSSGRYGLRAVFLQNWIVNFRPVLQGRKKEKDYRPFFLVGAYRPLGKAIFSGKYWYVRTSLTHKTYSGHLVKSSWKIWAPGRFFTKLNCKFPARLTRPWVRKHNRPFFLVGVYRPLGKAIVSG